ncbi:unnamed protein product, partial [Rotaria magnacalcarata]
MEYRVDDQIKAMNDEVMSIEREYTARLNKPNKHIMKFKQRFQTDSTANIAAKLDQDNIEIDENKIVEEKNEK